MNKNEWIFFKLNFPILQRPLKKQKLFRFKHFFIGNLFSPTSYFHFLCFIRYWRYHGRSYRIIQLVRINETSCTKVPRGNPTWRSEKAIAKQQFQVKQPNFLVSWIILFDIKISSYRILRRVVLHVHASHPIRNVFLQGNSHSPNLSTFTVLTILVSICISYSLLGILRWWFRDFNLDEAATVFEVACVEIVSFQSAENTTRVGRFSSGSFPQIPAVFDSAQCFHPPQPSAWLSILRFVYSTRLCVFKDIARESSHVSVRIIVELNYLTMKWKWMIKILPVT